MKGKKISHLIRKNLLLMTIAGLMLNLTACTNSSSNNNNTGSVQNSNQQVEAGVVLSVRDVTVNANSHEVNNLYANNNNNNNNDNTINNINTVANSAGLNNLFGSVDVISLGRLFVNNNNNNNNNHNNGNINAQEITVRKNNGQAVAITQASSQRFSPGEYVKIVVSNGKALVTR